MHTTPVSTVADDLPFVDRVAEKVRTLVAVKPALVRLLEWQLDEELERTASGRDFPALAGTHISG
jgi:hypothetical protein